MNQKGGEGMAQRRTVRSEYGEITYTLEKKRIKNLNLRLRGEGEIFLSVPMRCPVSKADEFIRSRSGWIMSHLRRREERSQVELLPELGRRECYVLLYRALERVYPLVAPYGVGMPELKIRKMRSQWGNCHWTQGYITLNTALHRCPEHLWDYVALHELVHFIHHDHGAGFYAVMDRLMPDWRGRRVELKGYAAAIRM